MSDNTIDLLENHIDDIHDLITKKQIKSNIVEFEGYENIESIVQSDGTTYYHHITIYGGWYNLYNDKLENVTDTYGYIKQKWYIHDTQNPAQYVITLDNNPEDETLSRDMVVDNDFNKFPGLVDNGERWIVNNIPCTIRVLDHNLHRYTDQTYYCITCDKYAIIYQIDEKNSRIFPKYVTRYTMYSDAYNSFKKCFEIQGPIGTPSSYFDIEGFVCCPYDD